MVNLRCGAVFGQPLWLTIEPGKSRDESVFFAVATKGVFTSQLRTSSDSTLRQIVGGKEFYALDFKGFM